MKTNKILTTSNDLRWKIGEGFHDKLTEGIYSDAATIAKNSVHKSGTAKHFRFDRSLDKIVTSKLWGFPIMIAILSLVLWLTIIGANYPSGLLADLLIGNTLQIDIPDTTNFPPSGKLLIGKEIISYTSKVSNDRLSGITRALNGTTEVDHPAGSILRTIGIETTT